MAGPDGSCSFRWIADSLADISDVEVQCLGLISDQLTLGRLKVVPMRGGFRTGVAQAPKVLSRPRQSSIAARNTGSC